jgi:hypothetical protein
MLADLEALLFENLGANRRAPEADRQADCEDRLDKAANLDAAKRLRLGNDLEEESHRC